MRYRALLVFFGVMSFLLTEGILKPVTAQTLKIDKITSFTTSDTLRFVCSVSAEYAETVSLEATLRQEGKEDVFWRGRVGTATTDPDQLVTFEATIPGLHPLLWSPATPNLYKLTIHGRTASGHVGEKSIRFGFRSFVARDGQFFLNGSPVFLRGIAINPPGRTIPPEVGETRQFAKAYVRFLKSQNVNIIRMTYNSQAWFDVCDELGMMVYQGQYGSPLGSAPRKQEPPADFDESIAKYKELFSTYASHPSILIYILSNELPTQGTRGAAFHDYLTRAWEALKPWDSTRLYIGNAGYGEGREGDICDVHRYWGWYYNTFLTYYNLRDQLPNADGRAVTALPWLFGTPEKNQPLTFTECVGNFTGWSGEYNIIEKKQLGAQLNWTGHSAEQAADATAYQCFMVKQAAEAFRRLRPLSPRLSGLMPFSIFFDNWSGITNFAQMHPKPALHQLATSYQPILLSWELWTSQVYAGSRIHPIAHIINDSDTGSALEDAKLIYTIQPVPNTRIEGIRAGSAFDDSGVASGRLTLPMIPYYGTSRTPLSIKVPSNLPTGDYVLLGEVRRGSRVVSHNEQPIFIANRKTAPEPAARHDSKSRLFVYDNVDGRTVSALRSLSFSVPYANNLSVQQPVTLRPILAANTSQSFLLNKSRGSVAGANVLVIGEEAWSDYLSSQKQILADFLDGGGRVLILRQAPKKFDTTWLPDELTFFTASAHGTTYPPASRPFSGNMNINPERPDHPVFRGLDRHRLGLWSDYTGWDQTKPGFPQIYPVTAGFKFKGPAALRHTAILADYDRGLEGVALAEVFVGKGSVLLCGFDIISRVGLDPAADRLLQNLVDYCLSSELHRVYPFISAPIQWGNYASEQGTVSGPVNGLVVNADWVQPPTNPNARPLTQAEGAWNTRPGDLFQPHGRRLLGPYGYSTGSSLRDLDSDSDTARGFFCAALPSGRTQMETKVENRSDKPAKLDIEINDSVNYANDIPGHQTVVIKTALPSERSDIEVKFHGDKSLVLLSTEFK